jgi:hypothetical protein
MHDASHSRFLSVCEFRQNVSSKFSPHLGFFGECKFVFDITCHNELKRKVKICDSIWTTPDLDHGPFVVTEAVHWIQRTDRKSNPAGMYLVLGRDGCFVSCIDALDMGRSTVVTPLQSSSPIRVNSVRH